MRAARALSRALSSRPQNYKLGECWSMHEASHRLQQLTAEMKPRRPHEGAVSQTVQQAKERTGWVQASAASVDKANPDMIHR